MNDFPYENWNLVRDWNGVICLQKNRTFEKKIAKQQKVN